MFLNKNKKGNLIDLGQQKELKPEDIPIHTMLKDLYYLEHPEKKDQEAILEKVPLPPRIKGGKLSDIQSSSPFLSQGSMPKIPLPKKDVVHPASPQEMIQPKIEKVVPELKKPLVEYATVTEPVKVKPKEEVAPGPSLADSKVRYATTPISQIPLPKKDVVHPAPPQEMIQPNQ